VRTYKFSKIAGYKINVQKKQHFYTPIMNLLEKKSYPIHNSYKKYLGINIIKEMKNFYNENNTDEKITKERKLKEIHVHQSEKYC
jgi:hypothetical protein